MNKKVLSAILFSALFAGTGTFTSCIDNDEPAGIEELRGAKAELIRAKIAVEEANALAIAADAALTQAKAETEKAVAAYQKALAAQQEERVKQEALRTELQAATNEAEKARVQAEIAEAAARQAKAEADMEEAAKQHELNMKQMETSMLQFEMAYQNALKDLKLAEVTLTPNQQAAVDAIKKEINGYYVAGKSYYITEWVLNPNSGEWEKSTNLDYTVNGYYVDGLMDILVDAEQALFDAQQKLYIAMYNKESGNAVAEAAFAVKVAEHGLADAKAAAAKVAELAAKEIASTDWEKEAKDLKAEIDAADLELKNLEIEREKLAAEHKADYDKVVEADDARDEAAGEDYPVSKYENKSVAENAAVKALIPAMNGYNNGVFSYGQDDETFTLTTSVTDDVMKVDATGMDARLDMVENWIEKLEDITIDPNTSAANGLLLAGAEEDVEDAQEAYETAVANWNIALDAYVDGEFKTVPTTAYQTVVTAYNTNVEALAAAITAYNAKYKELYDAGAQAAKDAYLLTEKHAKFTAASKTKLAAAPYSITDAAAKIDAINLLADANLTSAISQIEAMYAAPATVTDATAKAQYAAGLTAVKAQLDIAMQQYALDNATAIAAEEVTGGNKGVNAAINTDGKFDKALTAAKKVVTDAAAKLTAAANKAGSYAALTAATTAYKNLAYNPYAQELTADAVTATAGMTANATYAAKTAGVNTDYPSVYEIKTTVVTAEEFTAATATKKVTNVEAVWKAASTAAFGYDDRVIALTDLTNLKAGDTSSAAYKLAKAQTDLKVIQDKIAAGETLTALVAELTAQKAVLVGEIDAAKAAVATAEAAYQKELAAYNAFFAEVDEKVETAKHEKATAERVMNKLNSVVSAYLNGLNYSFTYTDENSIQKTVTFQYVAGEDNAANLKHFFKEWALVEEHNVLTAEGEVKAAKAFLAMVEEGKYDAVAMETRLVEKCQATYDLAKADLDAAYERLAALLDSFSADAE